MRGMLWAIGWTTVAGLVFVSPVLAADDDGERSFEGSVELLYRNVSQNGSLGKYNEDFDGLDSGGRLSSFTANWNRIDSKVADFFRVEAGGLGGDPYERTALRMGRRNAYDLEINHAKQLYHYDLFHLAPDLDGHMWNSRRARTDVELTFHPADWVDVFLEFDQVKRDGTSLVMKSVETDLFLMDSPLDQTVKRYSFGGSFRFGPVDLVFRQTLRRYDAMVRNTTAGDLGVSLTNPDRLDSYDWRQSDTGGADLTTITLRAPLGSRVDLAVSAFGTLLGDETITSGVVLDASGIGWDGAPFTVAGGTSTARIEADHLMLDADLSVKISKSLDLHLQARTLDRDVEARQLRDLDGNGVPDDTEGIVNDVTPGSTTRVDYGLDTITGLIEWSPVPEARIRAGYRTIDRELERSGFEYGFSDVRNTSFESNSDSTVIVGLMVRPVSWFRLNADYEEGDVSRAFTATGPMETNRLRAQLRFEPQDGMRIDLGYLDYDNRVRDSDFRIPGACPFGADGVDDGCWNSDMAGSTYSVSFWHKANADLDYWFRWARRDVDSRVAVLFDTDLFFNSSDNGNSIYASTSDEWAVQINYRGFEHWSTFVRARVNNSDGDNDLVGTTFVRRLPIAQDYADWEVGATYDFKNGLYVGGRFRSFDYDDANDRLDYDGEILSLVLGYRF